MLKTEEAILQILVGRRLRSSLFESQLSSDPAWDILLVLFLANVREEKITAKCFFRDDLEGKF